MQVLTKTKNGLSAVVEVARNQKSGPVTVKVIAENQGIPVKYLEQLMSLLRSAGLVRSIRGAKGGYTLARHAHDIKVSDVFYSLEGPYATLECVVDDQCCDRTSNCLAREMWLRVEESIHTALDEYTVQDLADAPSSMSSANYQI